MNPDDGLPPDGVLSKVAPGLADLAVAEAALAAGATLSDVEGGVFNQFRPDHLSCHKRRTKVVHSSQL